MKNWKKIARYVLGVLLLAAGINHFAQADHYVKIMPPYFPQPLLLVQVSGAAEFVLGLLLMFRRTQTLAAWGSIALFVAVFPANIYMYQLGGAQFGISDWVLLARLPLQLVLIAWAYQYTKRSSTN